MPFGRRIWLATTLAVGLAGCKAGSMGSLSMLPRRNPPGVAFDLDGFVAEHNRNAEAIESLEARPTIRVAMGPMGRVFKASVNGKMALERPRNFKLELDAEGVRQADIGSNAEEFWFWVANQDRDQKWIYWCNYRDLESSELPVTYQPDWIIEAMGLRPITPQEAAAIQVRRGDPGTARLVFPPTRDRGEPYTREILVSTSDRRIKKLQIYSAGPPRVLIAEAQPVEYASYPSGSGAAVERCSLPQRLRLDWKREQLVLDVALGKELKVNQFEHERAADIFVEPEMTGYTRMNLAQMSRGDRPGKRTRTRQTIPPPVSGDDIHLGRPAPIKDDGPAVPRVGQRSPRPPADDADRSPMPALDALVGAPIPRPPASGPSLPSSSALLEAPGRDLSIE